MLLQHDCQIVQWACGALPGLHSLVTHVNAMISLPVWSTTVLSVFSEQQAPHPLLLAQIRLMDEDQKNHGIILG